MERIGMTPENSPRHPVEELAEDFVARSRRGEQPAVADYVKKHPELAAEIEELFPALVFLEHCGQASQAVSTVEVGRLGNYRLVREIGRGGMGIVYEAVQESLGRRVALKVLSTQALLKPTWLDRFQRESAAAARLHHTNIVPVYGVGAADGHHFFAMQFIDGESLRDLLTTTPDLANTAEFPSQSTSTNNAVSTARISKSATSAPGSYFREVAQIGVQVAEALAHAHGQGILHRDIKPGNLLCDKHGTIWVTDFGLAKVEGADDLTATGDLVGTLRYMPPERFQGKEDARSDIYSLGLTLYELATRRPAFDQTDRTQLIHQLTHETPTAPRQIDPAIPRDLETILQKAIEREPARRYANAAELADDLRRFLADMPVQARRSSQFELARRWCGRNPVLAGLISFSACMLLVVTIVSLVAYFETSSALALKTSALNLEKIARKDADTAKEGEKAARHEAEKDRDAALETLYGARMSLIHRAWTGGEMDLVMKTLSEAKPKAGQKDMRGWEWHFLDAQARRVVHTLDFRKPGVPGAVFAAAFSPDGQWLAADNGRMKVLILDVKTKQIKLELPQPLSVYRMAWSPDSQRLAVILGGGPVPIWDVATGKLWKSLQPNQGVVCSGLAWHPNSKQVATAFGKEILIWDAETGQIERTLATAGTPAWSPDGARLAVSRFGKDRSIDVWDVAKRKILVQLPSGGVLAWHRDNVRLAVACSDGTAQIWDTTTMQARFILHHPGDVKDVAWNADGDRLATACIDRALRVWHADKGLLETTLRNHDDMVTTVSWHPDGDLLATASTDDRVNLWDLNAYRQSRHGAFTKRGKSHLLSRSQSADGKRVFRVDFKTKEITILDTATNATIHVLPLRYSEQIRWSPTNPQLAWSPPPGNQLRLWDEERQEDRLLLAGNVSFFVWSREGKRIAACDQDGMIQVCDVASGKRLCAIDGREKHMRLAFSPCGDFVVAGGDDQMARIWSVASGLAVGAYAVGELHSNKDEWFVRWSPDNRQLVLPLDQRGLRVVDTATWKEFYSLRAHTDIVASVAWSPNNRRLASLSYRGTQAHVVLWNTSTGLETWAFSFPIDKSSAPRLAWSSDGRRLTCDTIRGSYSWDAPLVSETATLAKK